jgi:histo-blood group ABO system transferase
MNNIGLLIIATNKYVSFLQNLLESADKFFLKKQNVTYFIFTDKEDMSFLNTKRNFVITKINHKPWPLMTLHRYKFFKNIKDSLSKMDYLYYCDVDMRFVDYVDDEILSERVSTQHPYRYGTRGTPETNPKSLACVYPHENMEYFAGGFNGGSSYEFLKMSESISNNIDIDYSNGIIAVWHDESHMNRYFIDNPPTKILDPGYCYGETMNISFHKKLLALDKNHSIIRS